jgi:hypothetical protein
MLFVNYASWQDLPASADDLFLSVEADSYFFSRTWFETLTEQVMAEGQQFVLAGVIDAERLVALLPVTFDSGGYLNALAHNYSSLYSLLLLPGQPDSVLDCLVSGLADLKLNGLKATGLRLTPYAEDDQSIRLLMSALLRRGIESHQYFRFYNWIYRVQGSTFEQYMTDRPARVRNTIARKRRKLAREQQYRLSLYRDQDIEEGLAAYHLVYKASWKVEEQFTAYVDAMVKNLAGRGWLRLGVLFINDQPAAAQIWFVCHRKASIFKLAYDEDWKHYSPGSILIEFLMQQVIDIDRVEEIDFLTGNDSYKQDWMNERRQRWGMTCSLNPAKTGWNQNSLKSLKGLLKSWFGKV